MKRYPSCLCESLIVVTYLWPSPPPSHLRDKTLRWHEPVVIAAAIILVYAIIDCVVAECNPFHLKRHTSHVRRKMSLVSPLSSHCLKLACDLLYTPVVGLITIDFLVIYHWRACRSRLSILRFDPIHCRFLRRSLPGLLWLQTSETRISMPQVLWTNHR